MRIQRHKKYSTGTEGGREAMSPLIFSGYDITDAVVAYRGGELGVIDLNTFGATRSAQSIRDRGLHEPRFRVGDRVVVAQGLDDVVPAGAKGEIVAIHSACPPIYEVRLDRTTEDGCSITFRTLERCLARDETAQTKMMQSCGFYSGDRHLKCTINPTGDCESCEYWEAKC